MAIPLPPSPRESVQTGLSSRPSRFVIISGYHDFRSKRKANLHFIAEELTKRGSVFFLSLRYSLLTRFKDDPRHDLWGRANCVEDVRGVSCYLWRTPIHAFGLPSSLRLFERALFVVFARHLPHPAREALAGAEMIFIESGIALIHLPLIRRLNPKAKVVYLASDSLGAINQAATIKAAFHKFAHLIDSARLPSPYLRGDVPASIPCSFIPHGIEKEKFAHIGLSPYPPGTQNAVSVGSMLFDPTFFEIAGPMFPDVTFHVIGSGHSGPGPANVVYRPEMPFEETLPYIKHATFAIAPYGEGVEPYLTHTSMKLMQYGYLGVPAVCPEAVAGEGRGRFGYRRNDAVSIRRAVEQALASPKLTPTSQLDWAEVTERWVDPSRFPDAELDLNARRPSAFSPSPSPADPEPAAPRGGHSPLVSVVIPVRDRQDLLDRAVRSVAEQTMADVEIIIVDDASERPIVVPNSAAGLPVQLIRNAQASGAQRSRLIGAEKAQGTYVALLDSDDWWEPSKLNVQLAALKDQPETVVASRVIAARGTFRRAAPLRTLRPGERIEDFLYVGRGMLQTSTIVARRKIIVALLDATADGRVHNDTMLFLEAQRRGLAIVQLAAPLSFFDDNPRPDRVSYDLSRVQASEAWFNAVSGGWSVAARRGFMLTDTVTRYVNTGQRGKALFYLLKAYHPKLSIVQYLKKAAYVACGGSPLKFLRVIGL